MSDYLFNQKNTIEDLERFFKKEKANLNSFGNKVNQTFEAYTFAETIKWYKNEGWSIRLKNPLIKKTETFRLKFSTRGTPDNFSYAVCTKGEKICQIRHQLRVSTKSHLRKNKYPANICCDIAIIHDSDLQYHGTDDGVSNEKLISFAEVKHMSAFAELVAGFVGMVHELQPRRLKRIRVKGWPGNQHIAPFLNLSGYLHGTAKGLSETLERRKYDIDIYHYDRKINK